MSRIITVSALGPKPIAMRQALSWEEQAAYATRYWLEQLDRVKYNSPDLVVLPEYCDIGEGVWGEALREYVHIRGDRMLDCMSVYARQNRCAVAYSSVMECDGLLYNAIRMIDSDGGVAGMYCKNHPVTTEMTGNGIQCGADAPLIRCSLGSVSCLICFDLNFEDMLEKYKHNRLDSLIFSSMYHGGIMQQYWAYACQSHFIGACAGLPCTVLSPLGDIIASSSVHEPSVTARINLDCRVVHIDEIMDKLRAAKRKYKAGVDISTPGLCNLLVVSSLRDDKTTDEILTEFDIEPWDHYYLRSLKQHAKSNG